jgi:hypothetical protein
MVLVQGLAATIFNWYAMQYLNFSYKIKATPEDFGEIEGKYFVEIRHSSTHKESKKEMVITKGFRVATVSSAGRRSSSNKTSIHS